MLIDGFTVCAQIINFLILIWLLKRFLYKPILQAIDARELRIAEAQANSDSRQAQVATERALLDEQVAALTRQASDLLHEASLAASVERQRLLESAREEVMLLRQRQQETMERELGALCQEMRYRTCQQVFAIARKALADLAGQSLEVALIGVFIDRVKAMTPEEQRALRTLSHTDGVVIRSTDSLIESLQETLRQQVIALWGHEVTVKFETASELCCGLEIRLAGYSVAWNIARYLDELQAEVIPRLGAVPPPSCNPHHAGQAS